MEPIRNIKVSAHYDVDTAPSKFDALFAQYEVAKAIADETENTKQPLIDAMGEKKLELIYKQLDVIVQRLNIISKCKDCAVTTSAWVWPGASKLEVKITTCHAWKKPEIYICGYTIPRRTWFEKDGIVTLWNQLGLYEKLEKQCEDKLNAMIEEQNNKTKTINENFSNMIAD